MKFDFPFLRTNRGIQITLSLIFIFLSSLAIDQISKRHAHDVLMTYEDPENLDMFRSTFVDVGTLGSDQPNAEGKIGSWVRFKLHYQRNRGAAFSLLAEMDDKYRIPFFYAVTLISVIYILYYLRTLPLNFHLTRFGLVMIMSGAIGNFIDRLIQGYVIDFFDVSWNLFGWRHDFAVFNVADVAINIGIIAFVLEILLRRKPIYGAWQKIPGQPETSKTPSKA